MYGSSAYASVEYGAVPLSTAAQIISIRPKGPATALLVSPISASVLSTRPRTTLTTTAGRTFVLNSKRPSILTSRASVTVI